MKNKEISFTGGLLKEALPLTSAVSSPNGPPLKIKNPYLQKENQNFIYEVGWWQTLYQSYNLWWDLQLYGWTFFYVRPFRGPNISYELLDLFYKEQNIEFFK